VVLDSGESRTLRVRGIETDDLDPGEYEYVVSTDDDSGWRRGWTGRERRNH